LRRATASGKECPVREHVRKVIEQARRPGNGIGIDDDRDPALRLASETIRLARLAASTHMILSARLTDVSPDELLEPTTARGQSR
jgi:hypothetical protein